MVMLGICLQDGSDKNYPLMHHNSRGYKDFLGKIRVKLSKM